METKSNRKVGTGSDSCGSPCSELRMSGQNARSIILNCHAMMRGKFRSVPLWSMVGKITGHGSGNSAAICESANLDPHQPAGVKSLRDYFPNTLISGQRP